MVNAGSLRAVTTTDVQDLVLRAMQNANVARMPDAQLTISPDAPLFGPGSALDSLGLVSLLIDIEDALRDRGIDVMLSDARAMSQKRSPFRSVASLVAFIQETAQITS
jgi:acyl carrier protein